jgi:hypothetical protein
MSEPGRDSIPSSMSRTTGRPLKKRPLTAIGTHASQIDALFAKPERELSIPEASSRNAKSLAPPPEIVANVQGSSAGAGSGEFHVYKASRRREYERLRLMDEEVIKEEADKEWEGKIDELKKRDEQKTNKNKARREKAKARKQKGKHEGEGMSNGKLEKKGVAGPMKLRPPKEDDEDDEPESMQRDEAPVEVPGGPGLVIHDDD